MGTGKEMPSMFSKPASLSQEAPVLPSYLDLSSSMQAFYGRRPSLFPSTVTSPTPQPFMWGSQRCFLPTYGTAVPYSTAHSPEGAYSGPNNVTIQGTLQGNTELNRKITAGKDHASSEKAKGPPRNYVLISGKHGDAGKATLGSGTGAGIQSAKIGYGNPSDLSNDDNNYQVVPAKRKGSFSQMLADAANAQNTPVPANFETLMPSNPAVSLPATNLDVGMGLLNASQTGSGTRKMHHCLPGVSPAVAPSRMANITLFHYERELKKQKRMQSNRESARRSRLRKQAESEDLQQRVDTLSNENHGLRDELLKLSEECEKLTSENNSLKEELTTSFGLDVVSKLENIYSAPHLQAHGDDDNR